MHYVHLRGLLYFCFAEAASAMEVRAGLIHKTKTQTFGSNPLTEIYVYQ